MSDPVRPAESVRPSIRTGRLARAAPLVALTGRTAGEAVMTFRMPRAIGARIRSSADRAEPGVQVTVTLGPFTVPNEVVYSHDEPGRIGFAYGTRAGHQEQGEEAFLVEKDTAGRVWFEVVAFSRPARWPTIVAGPIAVLAQRAFARLCGHALKGICTVKQ